MCKKMSSLKIYVKKLKREQGYGKQFGIMFLRSIIATEFGYHTSTVPETCLSVLKA